MTGAELREARLRLGLTQAKLGALAEPPIRGANICWLEAERRRMSKATAERLAAALLKAEAAKSSAPPAGEGRRRPQPSPDGIGEELRAERVRLGLTQAELAALIVPPMDQGSLSRVEHGRVSPSKATVWRIRRALAAAEAAAK